MLRSTLRKPTQPLQVPASLVRSMTTACFKLPGTLTCIWATVSHLRHGILPANPTQDIILLMRMRWRELVRSTSPHRLLRNRCGLAQEAVLLPLLGILPLLGKRHTQMSTTTLMRRPRHPSTAQERLPCLLMPIETSKLFRDIPLLHPLHSMHLEFMLRRLSQKIFCP